MKSAFLAEHDSLVTVKVNVYVSSIRQKTNSLV